MIGVDIEMPAEGAGHADQGPAANRVVWTSFLYVVGLFLFAIGSEGAILGALGVLIGIREPVSGTPMDILLGGIAVTVTGLATIEFALRFVSPASPRLIRESRRR